MLTCLLLGGIRAQTPKIAIIGVSSTNPDAWAFVAGEALPSGFQIYFTDEEYRATCDAFTFDNTCSPPGEAYYLYTAPAGGLAAGTVVIVNESSVTANTFIVTGGGVQ
ncbi:MAG: hypothetical protein R3B47_13275 [Bacteroidia bacterium]